MTDPALEKVIEESYLQFPMSDPDEADACAKWLRTALTSYAEDKVKETKALLGELFAMVKGECPSLLNEDSGGNAKLALEIEKTLSHTEESNPTKE